MARGRKPKQTEAEPELARVDNRAAVIRAAVRWVADKQAEAAAINAEIREYKAIHIKGDLGFKLADFNAILRVANLEDERRDQFIDTLREGFEALGVGESIDWVAIAAAMKPVEGAPDYDA